ncbi:MAG: HD domain-containing protein [Actinobacteria bacterium]|nr:HD domain-containing protein [Actinomycetota bacterium]
MTVDDRLVRRLRFLVEVDRIKQVVRHNPLADGSRGENDAEHMWHAALAVVVLADYAAEPVDMARVLTMVLVHDLVEIDAGDVLVYDTEGRAGRQAAEAQAAERIFGLLPDDQAGHLRAAWEEFEARHTPEARFAAAVDRLLPVLLNHAAGGGAWVDHGVTHRAAREANAHVADGSPALGAAIEALLADAVAGGMLRPDRADE